MRLDEFEWRRVDGRFGQGPDEFRSESHFAAPKTTFYSIGCQPLRNNALKRNCVQNHDAQSNKSPVFMRLDCLLSLL